MIPAILEQDTEQHRAAGARGGHTGKVNAAVQKLLNVSESPFPLTDKQKLLLTLAFERALLAGGEPE